MKKEYTGGSVSYYKVSINNPTSGKQAYVAECNDIIEALGMDYAEGNAFKALWRRAAASNLGIAKEGYKDGLYDAEKVVFFGQRLVEKEKNASKNRSRQFIPVREVNHDIRAGVSEVYPRGIDDSPSVQPKRTIFPGSAIREEPSAAHGVADILRQERERDEQQRIVNNLKGILVETRMGSMRHRGSSLSIPSEQDRAAQAMGESSSGAFPEYQGRRNLD